ncbi:TPA: UDP-N-acetylmuramoyl-L-alanyl-D-glutamate--2,6-diaminopimelate ligase [Candidatus Nomurabacteria bacterium]|nr:MAG: UDP-N-acetylmuramoyl-L-alanyl-D-glutamate-2,6-diaminopimelate ligase [Parcubacteria bacterium RAAC4_OD1_1]HCY26672.1 UDP-N-acetylmuramoyl-L-alanyl-D-glutamate--2,6-diaminopimelate ligase [Candidatus Nomurabacteria bacterium]
MKILNEILKDIIILESKGNVDTPVSSVSLDSRDIEPHSLFVALIGNVLDGHSFIDEVVEKGAKVIVHEKDLSEYKSGVTYIKVKDTHEAVGIIASNFYGNPSKHLKLVGVTGTNGKTTTATLLHQLFRNLGYKAGMIGTIVNKVNDESYEAKRTTPDPISLNKILAEMVDKGCEYVFMEVSSHSISEKRVSGLSFVGGIFTNLTLDHLDYHKTIESYAEAKKGFFDMIPSSGFAIANIDDDMGEYMLSTTKAKKYVFGLKNAEVRPMQILQRSDLCGSDLCGYFNERLETKLIGEFNAYNILGIYAVAVLLGQDKEKIKEIIKDLDGAPGRFQAIKNNDGIIGIVDYAHTPDALENVLKTANGIKKDGRLIALVGCGGDRDRSKRPIMARIGYDLADILILTSDNPRTEKPEDILMEMQKGLPLEALDKVEIIVDRHMAIEKACSIAKSGDIILVAGKGHENYQEVNGVKHHFDDLEELEKYLK